MNTQATVAVNIVTFLRPGHWTSFKVIIDSVIRDKRVKKYILAISSHDKDFYAITIFSKIYKEKLIVVDGSALSQAEIFNATFKEVKSHSVDYVALLDDESTPEENWISNFLDNFKFFKGEEQSRVVMIGNTIDIFGKDHSYYSTSDRKNFRDGTLFEIVSFRKVLAIFKQFISTISPVHTIPVFKTGAYIGGGVFLPFQAIKETILPSEALVMFGLDTEYAWNLGENNYSFYACSQPIFRKPSSLEKDKNHVFGIFNPETKDAEVYYHIRNAIFISRHHTYQQPLTLLINVVVRTFLVCILGSIQAPTFHLLFKRIRLLLKASLDGYKNNLRLYHSGH